VNNINKVKSDLLGKTFDYLTVIKRAYNQNDKSHTFWLCKCDCGNEITMDGRSFLNNKFKSCGCADSLIGNKYGKLTVVRLERDNKRKHLRTWECQCECGNNCFAKEESLNKGKTHCGCIKRKSNYEDLTNKKYNMLTVINRTDDYISPQGTHEIRWLCKCNCGSHKNVIASTYDLKNGNIKSCGCYKIKVATEKYNDLTESVFGYLTVKERYGYKTYENTKKILWACDCSCGNKDILVIGENLKNHTTTSCGCRQKETQFKKSYNKYDLTKSYGIGYASNTNKKFYFDLEDYNKINKYTWFETKDGYLMCSEGYLIHRVLTNCEDYFDVDHIKHNQLDNRKNNLRITTTQQNCSNRKLNSNNKSGYSGIYFNEHINKWCAGIGFNNNYIYLGSFLELEDAIEARYKAEEKYFGEYSYKNSMKKEDVI
jgi:hypothetical protein